MQSQSLVHIIFFGRDFHYTVAVSLVAKRNIF